MECALGEQRARGRGRHRLDADLLRVVAGVERQLVTRAGAARRKRGGDDDHGEEAKDARAAAPHATDAGVEAGEAGLPSSPAPDLCSGLDGGPGLVDPGIRRRRLALGPAGRRRDIADRDRDDPVRIQDLERIVRRVDAEAGHRVLVALVVVGPDVDVPRGARGA